MKRNFAKMFRYKPCDNCPFVRGNGARYRMPEGRIREIVNSTSFVCHKSVDYANTEEDGPTVYKASGPLECSGLMSMLHAEKMPNLAMRIGMAFGLFDPDKLDIETPYRSIEACIREHTTGEIG